MINTLSNIFSEKVEVDIHNQLNKPPFLIVTEDGYGSAIKRLSIENLPNRSYAISLDTPSSKFTEDEKVQFERLNHYLDKANGSGINKRCDLVLFVEDEGVEDIYIFDLKSSDPDPVDVCKQLVNSEIYIKYILELAHHFYQKDVSGISIYKAIGTTRVRKRKTYPDPQQRAKLAKKCALFEEHEIKEITILPEKDYKGFLNFSSLSRLF